MPFRRTWRSILGASIVALAAIGVLAFAAIDPSLLRNAWAQTDETAPATAIQTPPGVPGLTYPEDGTGTAALTDPGLTQATPAAPAALEDTAGAPGLTETGGGLSTNLGGSDVAVASEGGSYEVDGPKRKRNRFPVPTPKP